MANKKFKRVKRNFDQAFDESNNNNHESQRNIKEYKYIHGEITHKIYDVIKLCSDILKNETHYLYKLNIQDLYVLCDYYLQSKNMIFIHSFK